MKSPQRRRWVAPGPTVFASTAAASVADVVVPLPVFDDPPPPPQPPRANVAAITAMIEPRITLRSLRRHAGTPNPQVIASLCAHASRRVCPSEGAKGKLKGVERLDQLSDEDLLVATAAGSPDAFGMFYERQVAVVLALLRQRTGSAELAADLAAETFAAAPLSCRRFRPDGPSATSWLLGIAQNKLRESARRDRVETRARERLGVPRLAFRDEDLERIEQLADQGQGALALLDQLPQPQRDAVRGRVVDEREYRELAEQLSCSEQLVRQNVSRGLRRLKTRLKETP